jgi:hypothetical protein
MNAIEAFSGGLRQGEAPAELAKGLEFVRFGVAGFGAVHRRQRHPRDV